MALRMLKRFFFSCVTIFFVIAFNFFLFRVMPGNVETIIAKANTSEAVKARLMEEAGLDAHNSLSDTTATAAVMATQMMQENLTWEDIDTWQENQIISPEGSIRNASMEGHEPRLVMAFGKWKDQDIYEMAQTPEGISYLKWAKENVFSAYTLQVIAEYFKMRKYGKSSDHTINK